MTRCGRWRTTFLPQPSDLQLIDVWARAATRTEGVALVCTAISGLLLSGGHRVLRLAGSDYGVAAGVAAGVGAVFAG
jgi:hypothetical protein